MHQYFKAIIFIICIHAIIQLLSGIRGVGYVYTGSAVNSNNISTINCSTTDPKPTADDISKSMQKLNEILLLGFNDSLGNPPHHSYSQISAFKMDECRLYNYNTTTDSSAFPCEFFHEKSMPAILPGGSVFIENNWWLYGGKESTRPWGNQPTIQNSDEVEVLEGHAILLYFSTHYYHFLYDTLLRLQQLAVHGIFEYYKNATVLCHPEIPLPENIEFYKEAQFNSLLPINNFVRMKPGIVYSVKRDSKLIVPQHNDFHVHGDYQIYNEWLINGIRQRIMKKYYVKEPQSKIFLSRKGYRRGIKQEEELFKELRSSFIPDLQLIIPHNLTVEQQAKRFSNANLIISAHGAALTNVIFSNWDKLILIELSPSPDNGGHYASLRLSFQVTKHYLLKCQSVPCMIQNVTGDECHAWERQLDVNVTNATQTIKSILFPSAASNQMQEEQKDFFIASTY